jgi:hypothetical protein
MTANEKIKPTHLQHCTYVYVRQSTAAQVQYNRESTDRQYKLIGRALRLVWSKPQIKIIDEDLAHLGSQTSDRHSFAMMTSEVALDHLGLILSIEVSRVACNPALRGTDCYRLLDLCSVAYTDTLIADVDELYHLGFLNDRLLGPAGLALVPLPRSLISLAVKFFLRNSLGHPHLYRHPSGLDQSNLYRPYLTLVLPDESRSFIPAAWTDMDMNNFQYSSYDRRLTSAVLGSLSLLLHARKVVDSLLRKIDASEQAPTIPSKEEKKRAKTTHPLARRENTAPGAEPLGRPRSRDAKNDHRHTVQVDQQGGLSKNSGGQP